MIKHVVAVIDAGGRGSALVAAYSKNPYVSKIIAIPGNDLMQLTSKVPVETHQNIKTTDVKKIIEICRVEHVFLVDVAQDNAIAVGLTDALLEKGFLVVGPTQKGGEIEWNKAWAREFMKKHNIPQPEFFIFHSQEDGITFVASQKDQPWFVKASGLAEGKGALPAKTNKEAIERIRQLQKFGDSGKTYVLEKWLTSGGQIAEEFSAFAISDGNSFQIIGYAQDHKRVFDGDIGENTGGMGVSSSPLVVDENVRSQTEEIFTKTFDGLKKEGRAYKGILYLGGIIISENSNKTVIPSAVEESHSTDLKNSPEKRSLHSLRSVGMTSKVYVIEFNARWGDPEAQVIIPSIQNDFFEISVAVAEGKLESIEIKADTKARVAVAGVSKGYPVDYKAIKGKEIFGLEKAMKVKGVTVYGAGVTLRGKGKGETVKKKSLHPSPLTVNPRYIANGGRLFYIVGEGKNILTAREKAYKAMSLVSIEGNNLHYRKDIGYRDVKRLV